jgi:glutathione reductase (NADPH)
VLVSTVELFLRAKRGNQLGIKGTESLTLDWPAVIARKDDIVARWSKGKDATPAKLGIPVIMGRGVFAGPQEINVDGRNYTADKFVIATGSKPARPAIPGAELGITSDDLIHLPEQPKQLVIAGGGFVGLEFGFALAWAGTKVTILQSGPQIAPALDDEIREILLESAKEAGIAVRTNVKVKSIGADKTVEAEIDGRIEKFAADQVMFATGRPSTSNRSSRKPPGSRSIMAR